MCSRWMAIAWCCLLAGQLAAVGVAAEATAPAAQRRAAAPRATRSAAPTPSARSAPSAARSAPSAASASPARPTPLASDAAAQRGPVTLSEASWTYQAAEEPKQVRLNDLIVVLVDEKTQVISEGEMDRRKKADGTWVLGDWIGFDGLAIRPDPQTEGEPTVMGEMQGKYRAEAGLETRDSMKFRISCRVVDIRPNGNLVLEGRRSIQNNEDTWEMWLIGTVRPEDVLPNNTVMSENVAELRIVKRESGHVRDGYRRGFLMRFLDRFGPI